MDHSAAPVSLVEPGRDSCCSSRRSRRSCPCASVPSLEPLSAPDLRPVDECGEMP